MTFASPVTITADTTYVASYFAPNGHYSAAGGGLTAAVDNAPLHSIANGVSANGVYAYSAHQRVPDEQLQRHQLLGGRDVPAGPLPGAS